MTTTFTVSMSRATRRTVRLSLSLLSRPQHFPPGVGRGGSTLSPSRVGHRRWALALLWLFGLGWSTNAIAQPRTGVTVAGDNGAGSLLNQLNTPQGVFADGSGAVYVADQVNNRIMKFPPGSSSSTSGTIVAGGQWIRRRVQSTSLPKWRICRRGRVRLCGRSKRQSYYEVSSQG